MDNETAVTARVGTSVRRRSVQLLAFVGIAMALAIGGGARAGADDGGPPLIVPFSEQESNANDWYNEPVYVWFYCPDDDRPVTCPRPMWFVEGQTADVSATDGLNQTANETVGPFRIDQTPPVIAVVNNGRTYHQNELVTLGCDVSDALSGLEWVSNPCPSWGVPAANFAPGTYWQDVEAVDLAGNYTRVNTNFIIVK